MSDSQQANSKALYSENNEETIVREYFNDRKDGIFVDIGAGHPIEKSTTCYLEKHLRWSGLCIDALPQYAPLFKKFRPESRFCQHIVTDYSGTVENFYWVKGLEGLSSTDSERKFRKKKLKSRPVQVPTITLDELLEREGVSTIDFLSIDIEVSTVKSLSGFTIERFRPALVCIEVGGPRGGYREPIRKYFETNGYKHIRKYLELDSVNWWFELESGDGIRGQYTN